MNVKDRKNLADAKKFAIIYTIVTTLLFVAICILSIRFISVIPIIGRIISGLKIVGSIIFAIVHIIIAAIINAYFSLYDIGHKKLGYGYYAQRRGIGPHARKPLDKNFVARVGLFFWHSFILLSITFIISGILGSLILGVISILLNTIMMFLQRVIYTPKRARCLK